MVDHLPEFARGVLLTVKTRKNWNNFSEDIFIWAKIRNEFSFCIALARIFCKMGELIASTVPLHQISSSG
jgi:hypothetical protein